MTLPKAPKSKGWHTPKSPKGSGDYYGTGVKQKVGKVIDGLGQKPLDQKKIKKPPRSLA